MLESNQNLIQLRLGVKLRSDCRTEFWEFILKDLTFKYTVGRGQVKAFMFSSNEAIKNIGKPWSKL